jgi:hypothetical protein
MAIVVTDIDVDCDGDWEVTYDDDPYWCQEGYVPRWVFPTREALIAHLRTLDGVTVEVPEPRFQVEDHRVYDREAKPAAGSTAEQGGMAWTYLAIFYKPGGDDGDPQAAVEYAEWLNSKAEAEG